MDADAMDGNMDVCEEFDGVRAMPVSGLPLPPAERVCVLIAKLPKVGAEDVPALLEEEEDDDDAAADTDSVGAGPCAVDRDDDVEA